jgi:hypothetical protein
MLRSHTGVRAVSAGNACKVLALFSMAIASIAHSSTADAATHQVAATASKVDCGSLNGGVRAGDTIVLAGRTRGPVTLSNCTGTAGNPITVRNDTSQAGPLVIEQGGTGFQTECVDCEYVVIDGTGKWAGAPDGECGANLVNGAWRLGTQQCGLVLKCTSGSPHSGLRLSGSSKHVTVKGVEVDANFPVCKKGIGISVNDHGYLPRAGEWREGIRLLNNYVHSTEGEGIYMGPNQAKAGTGDMQLRNNEIAFNYVDKSGCDAINFKSSIAGQSSIHHNYVTNTGLTNRGINEGCTGSGVDVWEGGFVDIHSNYIEAPAPVSSGPGNCINVGVKNLSSGLVASVPIRIYNNVLRNCKGHGILATRGLSTSAAAMVNIYNNTVIPPVGGKGISVGSAISSCLMRDNIVAGRTLTGSQCSINNNSTESVESQRFRDADSRDFRLTAASPAVDVGTQDCPDIDHIGTSRPQEGRCDIGAYEFKTSEANASKPQPPQTVSVE